ncbi:tRNA (adenosine(37)-N6)-threonylcarbamoyltransferase complex ATPase subunit type 1 TsaE [Atopococcus tabaci]|uniref:tRNA (adenosine(37)-N6)-threonylcarbamoyltransferase complex ATPase subunit type 1 TsaE n=1 Tax=Atopococcus tabaci TaxID=269774 RepID=UPI00240A76A7|nr:tRNA (adenosine(37)-N6)-threonylcarbamoyltransferase complex ATPase subunit type 1 TsaE [Atopococcus tabaci]
MRKTYHTTNEQETKRLAAALSRLLLPGSTILLEGQLGAGKTTFTKGLAEELGIERAIKSPTYTLIREYTEGRLPLYHMDLYRLEETGADEMGLEEYFEGEGVSVVEWGSLVEEEMPDEYLKITFAVTDEAGMERDIQLEAVGKRYEEIVAKLSEDWEM